MPLVFTTLFNTDLISRSPCRRLRVGVQINPEEGFPVLWLSLHRSAVSRKNHNKIKSSPPETKPIPVPDHYKKFLT